MDSSFYMKRLLKEIKDVTKLKESIENYIAIIQDNQELLNRLINSYITIEAYLETLIEQRNKLII